MMTTLAIEMGYSTGLAWLIILYAKLIYLSFTACMLIVPVVLLSHRTEQRRLLCLCVYGRVGKTFSCSLQFK